MEMTVYLAELKGNQIKAKGEFLEVSFGWHKGLFPVEESVIPEIDTLALFYIAKDDVEKENTIATVKEDIIAVDAVYHDKHGFKSARLFGKKETVPQLIGKSQITTWFKQLPLPRRRVRINVVNHEGEQLFESGGAIFDLLNAHDEFEEGQLSIIRRGEVLDKTRAIQEAGTHGACTCFCGLNKFFGEKDYRSFATAVLSPEDFRVEDILLLDVLALPNFDFLDLLRQHACFLSTTLQVLKEKPKMTVGEFKERFKKEVPTIAERFKSATVIRFREKK